MSDLRDAFTRFGKAVHFMDGPSLSTFCGRVAVNIEPEEPGTKREWRERVRDRRRCRQCELAVERWAERN